MQTAIDKQRANYIIPNLMGMGITVSVNQIEVIGVFVPKTFISSQVRVHLMHSINDRPHEPGTTKPVKMWQDSGNVTSLPEFELIIEQ